MKVIRCYKGYYKVNINGIKIDIMHGCDGWYAHYSILANRPYSENPIITNAVDSLKHHYPTKKELLIALENELFLSRNEYYKKQTKN